MMNNRLLSCVSIRDFETKILIKGVSYILQILNKTVQ